MTEIPTSLPPDSHLCIFQGGIDSYSLISKAIFPHCSLLFFVIWVKTFDLTEMSHAMLFLPYFNDAQM